MNHIEFLGDENIEQVAAFLGDRLTERIVDSSKGCLLTHITFRSPDGHVTVPVGTVIQRNPTGTCSPFIPAPDLVIGGKHVMPMH